MPRFLFGTAECEFRWRGQKSVFLDMDAMVVLISDMKLRLIFIALFAVLTAGAFLSAYAQSANPVPTTAVAPSQVENFDGLKVREIHPRAILTPIPIDEPTSSAAALEFRSVEQMTDADRSLAEASQGEIARRAGLQGLGFEAHGAGAQAGVGNWGYEQAVCPIFPEHLILEYSRTNSKGDVSLFSAVIPRGEGHVRVIPVERRGNSLFTPAGSNALTVNDFNHIVAEEHHGLSPDWLTLGLCYAALAGGHVRAQLRAETPEAEVFPLLAPPRLSVSYNKPGAEVYFADFTRQKTSRDWELFFSGDGRLLNVKHGVAPQLMFRQVPGVVEEQRGVPVNGSIEEIPVPKAGN